MLSITMKMMKKNLRMLIPAGIAILIGTAFIAATLLFTNAFDASLARTDHRPVRRLELCGHGGCAIRRRCTRLNGWWS